MQKFVLGLMACGLMAAAVPQFAFADQVDPAVAKLAAPVAEAKKVTVDARIWRCEGDVCKGAEQGVDQPAKRECAKVAKVLGPLVAYRAGTKDFSAEDLAACNAAAKT